MKKTYKNLLILILFIILFISYKDFKVLTADSNNSSVIGRFNQTTEKKTIPVGIYKLTNDQMWFVSEEKNGNFLFYDQKTGNINELQISPLKDASIHTIVRIKPGVTGLVWNQDNTLAVARYPENVILYDLFQGQSKNLDPNISNIVFIDGKTLAFEISDTSTTNNYIETMDTGTGHINKIISLSGKWTLFPYENQSLSLITRNENSYNLFTLNTSNKNLSKIQNLFNDYVIWSPTKKQFLQVYNSNLYLGDFSGINLLATGFNITGCAWKDEKNIYCFGEDPEETNKDILFHVQNINNSWSTKRLTGENLSIENIFYSNSSILIKERGTHKPFLFNL